jgi:hypothetical protein
VSLGGRSEHRPSLLELIRAGDPDAVAGFYDARAGAVREYCESLCPPELVDEATLAAFADFLGRVETAGENDDADELVLKAARAAATGRVQVYAIRSRLGRLIAGPVKTVSAAECRSTPELLAAEANGELPKAPTALHEHIKLCPACKTTAARIHGAEWAFTREPRAEPSPEVRTRWLELAARPDRDQER